MQNYSLLIGIASLIIAALSYFKQGSGARFLTGNYRNLIIKEILTKTKHEGIFRVINRNIGLLSIKEVLFALLFFAIEILPLVLGIVYAFFLVVITLPIIVTVYNLKLTRKDGFDLLDTSFKNEQLNKRKKRQLGIYGFLTYLFIINITFFLAIGFLGNDFFKIIELYLFSVAILLIVPEFACLFIMQYFLKLDYDKVIAKLLELYVVKVNTWVSLKGNISLPFEGVAKMLYPHITLDTNDGKRMLIKWKDVNILSFTVSELRNRSV